MLSLPHPFLAQQLSPLPHPPFCPLQHFLPKDIIFLNDTHVTHINSNLLNIPRTSALQQFEIPHELTFFFVVWILTKENEVFPPNSPSPHPKYVALLFSSPSWFYTSSYLCSSIPGSGADTGLACVQSLFVDDVHAHFHPQPLFHRWKAKRKTYTREQMSTSPPQLVAAYRVRNYKRNRDFQLTHCNQKSVIHCREGRGMSSEMDNLDLLVFCSVLH